MIFFAQKNIFTKFFTFQRRRQKNQVSLAIPANRHTRLLKCKISKKNSLLRTEILDQRRLRLRLRVRRDPRLYPRFLISGPRINFGFKKFGETHFDPFQHYDRTLDPPSRSFVDSICFVAKRNSLVWKIWRENLNLNTARESFKNRQKLLFCDLKGSLFDIFSQRKIKFGQAQKSGWGSID